jgi:hypothetical protein
MLHRASELDGSLERPRQRKMDIAFRNSNIRSCYKTGSLKTAASDLAKYKLDLFAVQGVT